MNKERLLNTFLDLVRIPSPSKNERRVADYIINFCNANGIEVYEDQANLNYGGNTGNVVAIMRAEGKQRIMFSAHMDTVLPCDEINPVIEDGIIRTDGTSVLGGDDKSGIAAMLELMLNIKENNLEHPELLFVFSFGEENGLNGATYMDVEKTLGKIDAAFILDSSGTPGEIIYGAPYTARGTLTVVGKEAHAGIAPELGVNALCVAADAISQLEIGRIDEETTCNIGKIEGGLACNIVIPEVNMVFEARSLNHDKLDQLLGKVNQVFEKTCCEWNAQFITTVKLESPGYCIDTNSDIALKASSAAKNCDLDVRFKTTGGGSDANIYNSKGISSLVLATGMSQVHTVNEFIKIEDIEKTTAWITEIMKQYI